MMIAPKRPLNEQQRLKALHDLLILDSPPEERFDVLTAYATQYFKVPIALINLIDHDRVWRKSACGMSRTDLPRDLSFCGHAILEDDVMIVRDARKDPHFCDLPGVVGEPFIRFYAGAPLIIDGGLRVGTFCLIAREPRRLDDHEITHLRQLARVVSMELQGVPSSAEFMRARDLEPLSRK